jgi:hypothetical protein
MHARCSFRPQRHGGAARSGEGSGSVGAEKRWTSAVKARLMAVDVVIGRTTECCDNRHLAGIDFEADKFDRTRRLCSSGRRSIDAGRPSRVVDAL